VPLNDPEKLRRRVGARIAEFRQSRGWTQEQLAEKIDVSTRYLQAMEGGRENLTLESLAKVGNVLRTRVSELFGESPISPAHVQDKKGRR